MRVCVLLPPVCGVWLMSGGRDDGRMAAAKVGLALRGVTGERVGLFVVCMNPASSSAVPRVSKVYKTTPHEVIGRVVQQRALLLLL